MSNDNIWKGRLTQRLDDRANDFNTSIAFDSRMYKEDIYGSIAHVKMLGETGIIQKYESKEIEVELKKILSCIERGELQIDPMAEDIHSFVETELTKRLGDLGKKLHTARSRNDQVALDTRMVLKKEVLSIQNSLKSFLSVIVEKAEENLDTIMPSYTHMQRAQPITFAHHLLAYAAMFIRDCDRLSDVYRRMNVSPLGSCALAGTTYPIDRQMVADMLGFDGVSMNSMDGVSDRDFCIELASALSLVMQHLSRFSEEIILWSSWEFKFIELDDAFSTGSSIMPQKKNPDIAELVRGKCGRVYGNLVTLLTVMKGLPLAYNKDMQEDKEAIFDSVDTVKTALSCFSPMLATAKVLPQNMLKAAERGFINATDCADYLTKKGMPFRDAYKLVGSLVNYAIEQGLTLEKIPLETYREQSELFEKDVYEAINMKNCAFKRSSEGGPAKASVLKQIEIVKGFLAVEE